MSRIKNMYVKSYAKINVGLNVNFVREDGYHDLDMVMLPLKLFDFIEIERLHSTDTYVVCDEVENLNGRYNLVTDTINALREKYHFKTNYLVTIHKEIPIRAGLGGGSSNAAAVMKAVLKDNKINATEEEIIEIAKSVGADVPYFLYNTPARVRGIGEKVDPIRLKRKYYVLIIKPEQGLSTPEVFKDSDSHERHNTDIEGLIKALGEDDQSKVAELMGNSLEESAMKMLPEIKKIKEMFKKDGLDMSLMSGSGSCVYAMHKSFFKMLKLRNKYEKLGYDVILTRIL